MKLNFLFHLSLITALIFSGCSDDDGNVDTIAPIVKNVSLNGMSENITIVAGTEVEFEAEFEDDIQLGQYKFDIHNNFDGHSHGRVLEDFSLSGTYDLEGTSQPVHEHIDIPSNATPGEYHFTLQFFDAAGNEGEVAVLVFEIVDPTNQPVIEITSHDILSKIEVTPGGNIRLEGKIEDPDGLEEVHILLAPEEENHSHGRLKEEAIFDQEFILDGSISWDFSNMEEINIPEDTAPGHYELTIRATDVKGFEKLVSIEVHVE